MKRKCGHELEGGPKDRCQECNRLPKLKCRKKKQLSLDYMDCPASLHDWVQAFVPLFEVTDEVMSESIYSSVQLSRYPDEKTIASRSVVPADQVIRRVHTFDKANLVNKKEVNCKTIVEPFAGGSGILQQVQFQLKGCLTSVDFKKFESISVDHPKISKEIKLDQRADVYASQYAVPEANYICKPTITGGELVAFMYFAERCRDFCAFFLSATWINPTDALQRAWWGKKCMEKKLIG
ncbi:hypothetical protein CYMTET_49997 [Cymbomonas tetramitiformis]|uniref:Uncharacterized protein n=1 Tax=Cymbomonas tetramitiformis TaxID=36881 RepID=A0AAE0ETK8_9CHLO|nr:hypothetical protein CYMTET_49997 [Cymbomonas tetramitiformis]